MNTKYIFFIFIVQESKTQALNIHVQLGAAGEEKKTLTQVEWWDETRQGLSLLTKKKKKRENLSLIKD